MGVKCVYTIESHVHILSNQGGFYPLALSIDDGLYLCYCYSIALALCVSDGCVKRGKVAVGFKLLFD